MRTEGGNTLDEYSHRRGEYDTRMRIIGYARAHGIDTAWLLDQLMDESRNQILRKFGPYETS